MGAPPDVVAEEVRKECEAATVEVHADNATTVLAFTTLRTQWRLVAGMVRVAHIGLDYGAIPPVLELLGVPADERADVFEGLRVMEQAALPILNEKPTGRDRG